jgi:hypothetical protein
MIESEIVIPRHVEEANSDVQVAHQSSMLRIAPE